VNLAFLLMSTTLAAGQETPPPAAVPPPVLVQPAPTWPSPAYGVPGGGCSSCAGIGIAPGCSDPCPCEGRKGLFNRRKKGDDCDCSPKEKRRLFHGFTTSACDDCGGGRDGLFSRLRAHFHKGSGDSCDSGCGTVGGCGGAAWGGPTVGGCALPPVPSYVAPATPGMIAPAPAEAPKPMEKQKEAPKTTSNVSLSLPAPTPIPVPAIPVLAGKKSPF
jgi:hypothetical protein